MELANSHIKALVNLQIQILKGREPGLVPASLGPLVALFLSGDKWKADGPARVRILLGQQLKDWQSVGPQRSDPADIREGLGRLWGVTEPPSTLARVAARRRRGSTVSASTIRAWHEEVLSSDHCLAWWRSTEYSRPLEVSDVPVEPRSVPYLGSWLNWPQEPDRSELIARARKLSATQMFSDRELVRALRRLVDEEVMKYLGGEHNADFARSIAQDVFLPWERENDELISAPRFMATEGTKSRQRSRSAARVLVQLFAFDVVLQGGMKLERELQRVRLRDYAIEAARVGTIRSPSSDLQRAVSHAIRQSSRGFSSGSNVALQGQFLIRRTLTASQALAASELIRACPAPDRSPLIEHYILARKQTVQSGMPIDEMLERSGIPRESHARIAQSLYDLADQAVRLQTVHAMNQPQLNRLELVAGSESRTRRYAGLSARDQGLIRAKRGRKTTRTGSDLVPNSVRIEGVRLLLETLRSVSESYSNDEVERLETIQQTQLSLAGALTTMLETQIEQIAAGSPRYKVTRTLLRLCVEASLGAQSTLGAIETALGSIPEFRHQDGLHLSWAEWRETATTTQLRALIAVRTAIDSKLVGAAQLDPHVSEASELGRLLSIYSKLGSSPRLSRAATTRLGMQGTWLGFLNRGELPRVKSGTAMSELRFLDGNPVEGGDVTLDVDASVRWHRACGDFGSLGRIRLSSLAGSLLLTRCDDFGRWKNLAAEAAQVDSIPEVVLD